jgi:ABC transporter substrate binding protein
MPCDTLPPVSLLTDLDAFFTEHGRCGDLDAGVEGRVVWIALRTAGRGWRGGRTRATHLRLTPDPPYRPGMDRRRFLLTSLAGVLAAPLGVEAQTARRVYRLGFLGQTSAPDLSRQTAALSQGLRDLGYEEGSNLVIEYRWAERKLDRLPALASELVSLKVDAIVTHGSAGSRAAKQATQTIPIVVAVVGYSVENGIVVSLSRPAGMSRGLYSRSSRRR